MTRTTVPSCGWSIRRSPIAQFRRGVIDPSAFADGDGLPKDQTAVVGGRLFVTVERLDRRRGFAPTGPSRLVVIDVATDTVSGDITLHGANAFGDSSSIVREPDSGKLVVASVGDIYAVGDGGLERVDPYTLQADGAFFVDETQLGGTSTSSCSATAGYAAQDASLQNRLVDFDPTERAPRHGLQPPGLSPDIALDPTDSCSSRIRGCRSGHPALRHHRQARAARAAERRPAALLDRIPVMRLRHLPLVLAPPWRRRRAGSVHDAVVVAGRDRRGVTSPTVGYRPRPPRGGGAFTGSLDVPRSVRRQIVVEFRDNGWSIGRPTSRSSRTPSEARPDDSVCRARHGLGQRDVT